MSGAGVVLHDYWRSSASYRVRIALALAGIEWRAVKVDLRAGAHREAANLAVNPQGLVPTLEIDGLVLTQSLAIIEYLDETRGLGLLPNDPAGRARVRAAAMALAVDVHPVCNLSVVREATGGQEPAQTAWMRRFIRPGLVAFERLIASAPGSFAFGPNPTLADLCLRPQLYNADRWGVDHADLPRVMEAKAACDAHPAFRAAAPSE